MSSHTPKRPVNARLARHARYRTGKERTIAAPKHAAQISVNRRCHLGSSTYELGRECHFGTPEGRFGYALINLELWRNDWRCTETRGHGLRKYSILSLQASSFPSCPYGRGRSRIRSGACVYVFVFVSLRFLRCATLYSTSTVTNYIHNLAMCESKKQNQG